MMNRFLRTPLSAAFALSIAIVAASGAARADEAAPPPSAPPPAEVGSPPAATSPTTEAPSTTEATAAPAAGGGLTNAAGQVSINANVAVSLSKGAVAKPIYLIPNVYYGATDKLSIGLTHGGIPGFPPAGGSLCLGGTDRGCPKLYNNLNLDVLLSLMRQTGLELAFHGGVDIKSIDPMHLALRVGVALKWESGPIGIVFDPSAEFGVNKRSEGNKERFGIPVHVGFQAAPAVSVGLFTGLFGSTPGFGDFYVVPLAVDGGFNLNPNSSIGAQFIFLNLLGKNSTADLRALILSYNFRT